MKYLLQVVAIGMALSLMACGKGMQSSSTSSSGGDNTGQGDGGGGGPVTPVPNQDPLQNIDYKGRPVNGGTLSGQGELVLEIDRPNQSLIFILPIPAEILPFMGPLVQMDVPSLPGAKVMPYNNKLAVSVPLKYLVRGGQFMDPQFSNTLPNGDRLPKFPDGEGAAFQVSISRRYPLHLYIGMSAGAVFIETPDWDSFMTCTIQGLPCPVFGPFDVMNESKTTVLGYVAIVPARSSFHSGVYVASRFSDALARYLDSHLKY